METQKTGHVLTDILLLTVGAATGGISEAMSINDLQYYDIVLALILKAVSILSFLVVLILNANKLGKMIKGWFITNNIDK